MSALTEFTVSDAVQALRSGNLSSRELTTACLERIDRLEPALHAFITLTPELALAQAEAADRLAWRRPAAARATPSRRCSACRSPSRTCSAWRTCAAPAARGSWKTSSRPTPPPPCSACWRPAWSCSARPTPTSLPWALPPRTRPTAPPTTPGTWRACRAGRAAAAPRRWRPAWSRRRWAPIPAAACASRPRSAG